MRALLLVAAACSSSASHAPIHNDQPTHTGPGGRHASHGMVAFGSAHHYLEHIPMFKSPHDAQVLLRVTLRDAQSRRIDLGGRMHTVKPATDFSLDALMEKRLALFDGELYAGNFEAAGTKVGLVHVTVEDVLLARPLPGTEPIADRTQEYLLFGVPGDAYLTNRIRESRGFQQILHVEQVTGLVPSPSKVTPLLAPTGERLLPGMAVALSSEGIGVSVDVELWCYEAPEFVAPCR